MPKTAGTTFKSILSKNYSDEEILDVYESFQNHKEVVERLKNIQLDDVEWLNCHLSFGIHKYVEIPSTYITFLRDPVDRIISEYFFILRHANHHLHNKVKKMNLLEFQGEQVNMNKQCKIISGKPLEEALEENEHKNASKIIKEHFAFVGITELFTESVYLMKKKFNWDTITYSRKNVTQNRNEISDECIQAIRENNQIDITLYNAEKEELEKQLSSLDKRSKRQLNLLLNRYKIN